MAGKEVVPGDPRQHRLSGHHPGAEPEAREHRLPTSSGRTVPSRVPDGTPYRPSGDQRHQGGAHRRAGRPTESGIQKMPVRCGRSPATSIAAAPVRNSGCAATP
jgi:hypothetical protein